MAEPKDRKTSRIVNVVAKSKWNAYYWIGIKEVGIGSRYALPNPP